jgi:hypothetical protein
MSQNQKSSKVDKVDEVIRLFAAKVESLARQGFTGKVSLTLNMNQGGIGKKEVASVEVI